MNTIFQQLLLYSVLGFDPFEYIDAHHFLILTIIIVIYFLVQPLIKYFVSLESIRLLSYVTTGLFVLFFLCFLFLLMEIDHLLLTMIKVTFQCLAVFGGGLAIIYSIIRFTKKT